MSSTSTVKPTSGPRRAALIETRGGRPSLREVEAYLPGNYDAQQTPHGNILVVGHDRFGWTLDGYVLPRLSSGMIFGREVVAPPAPAPKVTGSVSTGTLRPQDLGPAFAALLSALSGTDHSYLGEYAVRFANDDDWESASEALDSLTDRIHEYLPVGWRFGAHEGDGADFGVWAVAEDAI